jgi:hypothetical protein
MLGKGLNNEVFCLCHPRIGKETICDECGHLYLTQPRPC